MRRIDAQTAELLRPWFAALDFGAVRLVESGPVCWFVRHVLHQGAMTVGPWVFYGKQRFDPSSRSSLALLAHELHHVEQYRNLGRPGFLARYLRDLFRARFHYSDALPLEAEAYALQAQVFEGLGPHLTG